MKVANTKPKAVKSPVRISDTKYEMWYCKPLNLGTIDKRGAYWYTSDGMKFVSSRNALDYLIKLYELGRALVTTSPADKPLLANPTVMKKPATVVATSKKVSPAPAYNQNHPAFQEYLDMQKDPLFQDFMKFLKNKQGTKSKSVIYPDRSVTT